MRKLCVMILELYLKTTLDLTQKKGQHVLKVMEAYTCSFRFTSFCRI